MLHEAPDHHLREVGLARLLPPCDYRDRPSSASAGMLNWWFLLPVLPILMILSPGLPTDVEELVDAELRYLRGRPRGYPVVPGAVPAVLDAPPRLALQEPHVADLLRDRPDVRRVLRHPLQSTRRAPPPWPPPPLSRSRRGSSRRIIWRMRLLSSLSATMR